MLNTVMLLQYHISPIKKKRKHKTGAPKFCGQDCLLIFRCMLLAVGKESPKCSPSRSTERSQAKPNCFQICLTLTGMDVEHFSVTRGRRWAKQPAEVVAPTVLAVPRVMGKPDDLSSSERGTKT